MRQLTVIDENDTQPFISHEIHINLATAELYAYPTTHITGIRDKTDDKMPTDRAILLAKMDAKILSYDKIRHFRFGSGRTPDPRIDEVFAAVKPLAEVIISQTSESDQTMMLNASALGAHRTIQKIVDEL